MRFEKDMTGGMSHFNDSRQELNQVSGIICVLQTNGVVVNNPLEPQELQAVVDGIGIKRLFQREVILALILGEEVANELEV